MTVPENPSTPTTAEFLRRHAPTVVLLLVAMAVGRYFVRSITDDAFITYRYAQNLLAGHGFVYNPGERVLATTTPLYALLAAAWMALGMQPWVASLVLEALLLAGGLSLLAAWLEEEFGPASRWALVLFCLHNPLHVLTMAGMESTLFAIVVLVAIYLSTHGRAAIAVMLASISPFVRPEGALLLGIVGAIVVRDRLRDGTRLPLRSIIVGAAVLGAGVGCLWVYFGSPIPHSIAAKIAQGGLHSHRRTFVWIYMREQLFPFGYFHSAWLLLQLMGFAQMAMKPTLRWLVLWYFIYIAFLISGRAPHYNWYADPVMPARFAGLVAGACWLVGLIPTKRLAVLRKPCVAGAMALAIIIAAAPGFSWVSLILLRRAMVNSDPALQCKLYEKAGPWLRDHTAPEDEIFASEIGYVGYFSGRRVFDAGGIASPEALPDFGHLTLWAQALKRRSRWVVASDAPIYWELPQDFQEAYTPVQTWENPLYRCVVFERVEQQTAPQ